MSLGDYPILAAPSIGLTQFRSVLVAANSPAASEAPGLYDAAIQYGVDPAVLLAVFQHESSFGKAGAAVSTHNVGNLVYTGASVPFGAVKSGRWASYPTWTASAQDTARLLSVYGRNAIRPGVDTSSILSFPKVWAPSSDGNSPSNYGASLSRSIAGWTGRTGTVVAPRAAVKPRAPALAPVTKPKAAPAPSPVATPKAPAGPVPVVVDIPGAPIALIGVLALGIVVVLLAS